MNGYKINFSDTLQHHGVKGMKWGVRKERETSGVGRGNYKRTKKSATRVEVSRKQKIKTAVKIGGAIVAAGLLAYGGDKVSQSIKNKAFNLSYDRGKIAASSILADVAKKDNLDDWHAYLGFYRLGNDAYRTAKNNSKNLITSIKYLKGGGQQSIAELVKNNIDVASLDKDMDKLIKAYKK